MLIYILLFIIIVVFLSSVKWWKTSKAKIRASHRTLKSMRDLNIHTKNNNTEASLYTDWKAKNYFFSRAELFFYRELIKYSQNKEILIFSKVRIADLVEVKHRLSNSEFKKTFMRCSQKHVDYVITDYKGQLLCVLELDGKSHSYAKTIKSDEFKNEFFNVIWLPLLRFENYWVHNLKRIDSYV